MSGTSESLATLRQDVHDLQVENARLHREKMDSEGVRLQLTNELSADRDLASEEREKLKKAVEAWKDYYYGGGPIEDRGVHDTDKHSRTCGRWRIADPKESPVEAYMCGDIYDPRARCTCGADPTRKELRDRADKAEADFTAAREERDKALDVLIFVEDRLLAIDMGQVWRCDGFRDIRSQIATVKNAKAMKAESSTGSPW